MRRLTSIAAVLVMFLMMMPTLACAATVSMSRAEQDCCQQMHGMCGKMAKQGCCQTAFRSDLNQLPANSVTVVIAPGPTTEVVYPPVVRLVRRVGYRWQAPDEHSPPGLLIASSTNLRI